MAVVQSKVITAANSGNLSSPTTAGNTLIVGYAGSSGAGGGGGTPSISGVTIGGVTDHFVSVKTQNEGVNSASISAIWMDTNCAGGQTAVAVAGTNLVAADAYLVVVELSGMGSAPTVDVTSAGPIAAGTTTWSSDSGTAPTSTASNEFWFGITAHGPNSGASDTLTGPASPWVNLTEHNWANGSAIAGYQASANAGAIRYSGTSVGYDYYTCVVAAIKPSVAVTSTAAVSLAPAVSGSGTQGAATSAATGFAPSVSGAITVQNPVTSAGAATFAPATTGSASQPITSAGAVSLSPATSGLISELVTSTAAVSFAPATAGTAFVPVTSSGGVKFNPQVAGLGTTTVGMLVGSGRFTTSYTSYPGTSQVAIALPGSSNWQYVGAIGQVNALSYAYQCPGGCYAAAWSLMVPSTYRDQTFNVGNKVRITRGGHQVWAGKLDEPTPSTTGWNFTATGDGVRGSDYVAYYTDTWPTGQPDESINDAITRGLPWVNPGIGSPSGMWLGQEVDPGAQFITDLLNLVCTRGGLTWYVNSQPGGPIGSTISVFPLPTQVNRLIVCTEPIPRTLGGYINTLFIKYQVSADTVSGGASSAASAVYAYTSVQNSASADIHGAIEDYIDLSNANTMTQAQAQAVGNYILQIYEAASFAGPFTVSYGQLLTTGGQPIDPGTDQAGTVAQLIVTDYGYGGEVTPQSPITFIVGQYTWDDFAQVATITPFQNLDQSIAGLLSMENTILTPITTPGG